MFKVGVKIVGLFGTVVAGHLIDRTVNLDLPIIRAVGRRPDGSAVARRIVKVAIQMVETKHDICHVAQGIGNLDAEDRRAIVHDAHVSACADKVIYRYRRAVGGGAEQSCIDHERPFEYDAIACAARSANAMVSKCLSLMLTYSYASAMDFFGFLQSVENEP